MVIFKKEPTVLVYRPSFNQVIKLLESEALKVDSFEKVILHNIGHLDKIKILYRVTPRIPSTTMQWIKDNPEYSYKPEEKDYTYG